MPENILIEGVGQFAASRAFGSGEMPAAAFTRNQRLTLLIVGVAAYVVSTIVYHFLPLFHTPGFGGSLFVDANPIISLTMTFVWTAIVFVAALRFGRGVRPDVGMFAAAIALFAARRSGGITREVYLTHPFASTLWLFALELALLGVFLGFLHAVTRHVVARGTLPDDADLDGVRPKPEPTGQKILALLTHALVFAVIVLLTMRSDERMQVTAMLVIASMVASICTVRFIPATPSAFFWIGPIAAGLVGYLITGAGGTGNLIIGEPAGYCMALARALPLDYASAGVAGSIYGYWIGRGWIPADATQSSAAT